MKLLVVVDMQNDFVTGALGTAEAVAIVPHVKDKIACALKEDTTVLFTQDTHEADYLNTREGRHLPVPHCIRDTQGWEIIPELGEYLPGRVCIAKPTFGSTELMELVVKEGFDDIELIGLCTDICVISNAMLIKAALPEAEVSVDSTCCAGVTPATHANALEAMKMCQIIVK